MGLGGTDLASPLGSVVRNSRLPLDAFDAPALALASQTADVSGYVAKQIRASLGQEPGRVGRKRNASNATQQGARATRAAERIAQPGEGMASTAPARRGRAAADDGADPDGPFSRHVPDLDRSRSDSFLANRLIKRPRSRRPRILPGDGLP